jgi:hypothetical protein
MSSEIHMDAYKRLGNAVILQAARDYKRAYRKRARYPKDNSAKDECRELEEFFRSQRFQIFTDLDGPALLEKLQKTLQKTLEEELNGNVKAR